MSNDVFIVYMATNTVNGKRYIGATRRGLSARRYQHFKDSKRKGKTRDCPRFYDAIRKYGQNSFGWTILASLTTSEEMYKEEERLIALFKPEYNIASGGLIFTSKERQSEFSKNNAKRSSKSIICLNDGKVYKSVAEASRFYGMERHNLGDLCRRGGIARNGLSFSFFGKSISDEDREQILSERRLRKVSSEQDRITTLKDLHDPVTCLSTGTVYQNASAAERETGISKGTVSYLCRTGKINRDGFCFSFGALTPTERLLALESANAKNLLTKKEWKQNLSNVTRAKKSVRCDSYGITFSSSESASIEYCIPPQSIREVCSGKAKQVYGLKFSYVDNVA